MAEQTQHGSDRGSESRSLPGAATGTSVRFFVPGIPVTAGSKRAFVVGRRDTRNPRAVIDPRAIVTDDTGQKGRAWRVSVQGAARETFGVRPPLTGPLKLSVVFTLPYRAQDRRRDGRLKPTAPLLHEKRPDATKLVRALEDALTGILWHDDAQIVHQEIEKLYGEPTGAAVYVHVLDRVVA